VEKSDYVVVIAFPP